MRDATILASLAGRVVQRLILIVFPPAGETSMAEADMRVGLVLEDEPARMVTLATDMSDLCSPIIAVEACLPCDFTHEDFYERMALWMRDVVDEPLELETFDFTASPLFADIINHPVVASFWLEVSGTGGPFGLKLEFGNDYLISCPGTDGNTVETRCFNHNNALETWGKSGTVLIRPV